MVTTISDLLVLIVLRGKLENRHLETAFCRCWKRFTSRINQLGRTKPLAVISVNVALKMLRRKFVSAALRLAGADSFSGSGIINPTGIDGVLSDSASRRKVMA